MTPREEYLIETMIHIKSYSLNEMEAEMLKMEKESKEELEYKARLEMQKKALCDHAAEVSKKIKEGK